MSKNLFDIYTINNYENKYCINQGPAKIKIPYIVKVNDILNITISEDDSDGNGNLLSGSDTYQWTSNGVLVGTNKIYKIKESDIGSRICVSVTYTDDKDYTETIKSNLTNTVPSLNDGQAIFTIIGNAIVGETLFTDVLTDDPDNGISSINSYKWYSNNNFVGIDSTYKIKTTDIGNKIKVEINYTDGEGFNETVFTNETNVVPNINDGIGIFTILGNAIVGETLSTKVILNDPDKGISSINSYKWYSNNNLVGIDQTYLVKTSDIGNKIKVEINYTDGEGFNETVTTTETNTVPRVNDGQGIFAIIGNAIVGETLFTDILLDDPDNGISNINSYKWYSDNNLVGTDETYVVKTSDIGSKIKVEINYTDGDGFNETVTTNETNTVPQVNDGQGIFAIIGNAIVGETLFTDILLDDPDNGISNINSYKWYSNNNLVGIDETYIVKSSDIGNKIKVEINYTDGEGFNETVITNETNIVPNVNTGQGLFIIVGNAIVGETLFTEILVDDPDNGISNINSYKWYSNNVLVSNNETYVVQSSDVGGKIKVEINYTDGKNFNENVTTVETNVVENVNDGQAIFGIFGNEIVGEILFTDILLDDPDKGITSINSYKWYSNNNLVGINDTYVIKTSDIGNKIKAEINYTDGEGYNETVFTNETNIIPNTNDGQANFIIIGNAIVGETLFTDVLNDDPDNGITNINSYKWYSNNNLVGNDETYKIKTSDIGNKIKAEINYTDGEGFIENIFTNETDIIPNVNDGHSIFIIVGNAIVGSTLFTEMIVDDPDNGVININSYKWYSDNNIVGTNNTYTVQTTDIGNKIKVEINYDDGEGFNETIFTNLTSTVPNVNDGQALFMIFGNIQVGEMLFTDVIVDDPDNGISNINNYKWYSNNNLVGVNETYEIKNSDIGNKIKVEINYTDGEGFIHNLFTPPTITVPNVNDGQATFSIIGSAVVGQTLSTNIILDDPDSGINNINSYTWKSNQLIVGNNSTYLIKNNDIGNQITVTVNYIDGEGFNEIVTSNPTDVVINNQTGIETISIELNSGWNWISFNLYSDNSNLNNDLFLSNDILTGAKTDLDQTRILIKNNDKFSQYVDDFQNWLGSLVNYNVNDCFMVFLNTNNNMNINNNITFSGSILLNHVVDLNIGWNWIGFPEKNSKNISDVIPNANNGDFIKSQTQFTEYYEGIGWFGNLEQIDPLKGYLYKSTQNFSIIYNNTNNNIINNRNVYKNNVISYNSLYRVDVIDITQYEYTATLTAKILNNNILVIGGTLLCYVNEELRGIAESSKGTWISSPSLDYVIVQLTIYSNELNGEQLSFSYGDGSQIFSLNTNENLTFTSDKNYGTPQNPIEFNISLLGFKPKIMTVVPSWGDILEENEMENINKINITFENVVDNQVATIYITHDNLTNDNDTLDNIIDYIFKGTVINNQLEINIEQNGLIGLEKHILYTIVVDIENPNCFKADTHDTTQFIVSIDQVLKEENHTFNIGSIPITDSMKNFYKLLLDGIDMLILACKHKKLVEGFYNSTDKRFIRADVTIRYDLIQFIKIYNIKEVRSMNINLLHDIQIDIYGEILEYKKYLELYPDEVNYDINDYSIDELRKIEKELYNDYNDRNKFYQDHGYLYGSDDSENIDHQKLLLEEIHKEMYKEKLEYLIYKQRYGSFDLRNYNEGLLNDIIDEVFKI